MLRNLRYNSRKQVTIFFMFSAIMLTLLFISQTQAAVEYGIAANYPGDTGIENDTSFVFRENFEEASIATMTARWEDISNQNLMTFNADKPTASVGSKSVFFNGDAQLYRRLLPGYDQIYVRFYVKFDPVCSNIHHSVTMGGYNPTLSYPYPRAGTRPAGNERWSTGIEPMGTDWAWDFYSYWMHMRSNPSATYYGNSFSGRPSPYTVNKNEWISVEFMVKMNSPVTSYNGEQAFWINGEKNAHLGEGFPTGTWIWDGFYPGSGSGSAPFEGFQWRNTTALNINFLWLMHYVDTDPSCTVKFDDIVVATQYIGPMVASMGGGGDGGNTPPPSSSSSGSSDSGGGSGGGCGFMKGKRQLTKGGGLSMIMLFLFLIILRIRKTNQCEWQKVSFAKALEYQKAKAKGKWQKMRIAKSMLFFIATTFIFLLFAGISNAATYYVSNSGSATWAQCTNINTPCAVQRAFSNAVAGDIVYFRGGTYDVPAKNFGSTYHGYYEPAYSGTSGNPITFAAYTGETPIFNGTAGGTGDVSDFATIFGTWGRSYIVFDGFNLQANNGTKMARVHIGSDDRAIVSYGVTIKNTTIYGGSTVITNTDNREGLRADYTDGTLIRRVRVYNYRESTQNHNTSCYKGYENHNMIIENSEFYNCTLAIYFKRDHDNTILRYNWVHDNYHGFAQYAYLAFDNLNNKIYHNVFANNTYANIQIIGEDGQINDNMEIYNNTIYGANNVYCLFYSEGSNWKVWNNIIQGCQGNQYVNGYANVTVAESDYNQFGTGSFNVKTHLYNPTNTYTSLASWQVSGELIGGLNPDTHSLVSNPLFQNGSGNMNQLNDFRLANNSPSKGTGKGGVDMGANIDSVGTGGSGGDTQAPTVPTGLSAQAISSSQINLSWTASTDNVGVSGYQIYRCTGSSCVPSTQIATPTTTSYSDTGLSASTTYTYSVSAYDAAGNVSSQSSSASATTSSGGDSVGGGSGGSNQNTGSGEGTQQTTSQGSTEISGGGCGYIDVSGGKGNGSGGNASQALSFIMMLILILTGLSLARRASLLKNSTAYKTF